MKQFQKTITYFPEGPGLVEITADISAWVSKHGLSTGILNLFLRHTSASLVIQENADPDVLHDLEQFFHRLVPHNQDLYRHTTEGSDDMPAHIKSALTRSDLSIPVRDGHMALGTWHGIFLFKHRDRPSAREVIMHLTGE